MSAKLVVNELLAFLQQKLDVMDEDSALQICQSNFSEADIAEAKKLLFVSTNKLDQMVFRRRNGTRKSLQDIITLLKETNPDDVPTFVDQKLHKLPPVTFDHLDVTCLLKDIVSLKANQAQMVLRFEASERTVSELRKEVDTLRASLAICRSSPDASGPNINSRRGACLSTSLGSSFESAGASPPAAVSAARAPPATAASPPAPAPRPAPPPEPPVRRAATASPAPRDAPPRLAAPVTAATTTRASKTFAKVVTASKTPVAVTQPPPKVGHRDEDGFVKVQKKRKRLGNKNRCGTAATDPEVSLRAEAPSTPVYLSRLHYSTELQDVVEYIRQKTKVPLEL